MANQKSYKGSLNEAVVRLHHAYAFIEDALEKFDNTINSEKEKIELCRIQDDILRLVDDVTVLLKQPHSR